MEKAILKTLAYSDIFDYPLKMWEIHKWLISQKTDFFQVEKALERLLKKGKVQSFKEFYFLSGRKKIVGKRLDKQKQSKLNLLKIKWIGKSLAVIPSVKLVGVSGSLAMENADKQDDIDLFIITDKNRLWLSRLLVLTMLDLMGVRRRFDMDKGQARGKVCVNLLLEEDSLTQPVQDLYTAHEVLQMKVLRQKGETYSRFLSNNNWAFNFLPNWTVDGAKSQKDVKVLSKLLSKRKNKLQLSKNPYVGFLESLSKILQLKLMHNPKGQERILPNALYFHPEDYRQEILKKYKDRVRKY